jgi:hypothetical protein
VGGPPAWGLGGGLTTLPRKTQYFYESLRTASEQDGLLSVLYGCETWSLTLREEHRLRVFENRVLRRIFGPKRDEVTVE